MKIRCFVKKSDMITSDDTTLELSSMGLFDCDGEWIHPTITVPTYELIFVTSGEVHIRDGEIFYSLKKGDILLLDKLVEHGGTKKSFSHVSFYWLHFHSNDIKMLCPKKESVADYPLTERALKEIMHFYHRSKQLAELALFKFFLERKIERENKNPYA